METTPQTRPLHETADELRSLIASEQSSGIPIPASKANALMLELLDGVCACEQEIASLHGGPVEVEEPAPVDLVASAFAKE
jgi:hypothetical protein